MVAERYELETRILKAMAHPVRMRILEILRYGDHCVCHLEAAMGYRQAYISQHLMVLRDAGIVIDRREGWNIYYHVADPAVFDLLDKLYTITGNENFEDFSAAVVKNCPCPHCQLFRQSNC